MSYEVAFWSMRFVWLMVFVLIIASYARIFVKAGLEWYTALIPFYCNYKLFEITLGNGWLFLLLLVPFVNWIMYLYVGYKLAKVFNQSILVAILVCLLPIVGLPLIAFGDAQYMSQSDGGFKE